MATLGPCRPAKSTLEIHGAEVCSSGHALQCFLYPGEGIRIFLCLCIETSKINAELKESIFLFAPVPLHYTRETGWVKECQPPAYL